MNKVQGLTLLKFPISIHKTIQIGQDFLIENQISNAKNEIEWYLQKLYQCNKIKLYSIKNNIIKENLVKDIVNFLVQRSRRMPFQYLMGYAPFYGRDYIVDSNVLIPRPESELLIEIIKKQKNLQLLDIGTGSGCLAITARLEGIAQTVDALDISTQAIEIAQKNTKNFNVNNIHYVKMNILESIPEKVYDIIISNPPYLTNNEYLSLNDEIKDNEPAHALTDNSNGYTFYERFNLILPKILKRNGIAVFEFSHLFSVRKMKKIFYNFSNVTFYKDLNHDYRAIKIIND